MRDPALHELQTKLRVLSDRYRTMTPVKNMTHAKELACAEALVKVINRIAGAPARR